MNNLLIFFAFPIAVIIISVILQKLLNNPVLVAALIFAIFLIITFAFFDETFLIATLAYTILAFIAAFVAEQIFRRYRNYKHSNTEGFGTDDNNNENSENHNNCNCTREVVTANLTNETTGNRSSWRCYKR